MKKITDFVDLAAAKAHPEIKTKVFNSNEMTMYLLRCDLLDNVLDATSGLLRGFAIRVMGDSRFDFIESSDDGIANIGSINALISSLPDSELKTKFIAFRDYCIADANKVYYPYADVSQEAFELAHRALSPSSVESVVINKNVNHIVKISVNDVIASDDIFTVKASTKKSTDSDFYFDDSRRAYVSVKSNESGHFSTQTNVSGLADQIKYHVTSKYQRNFTVDIIEV